MCSVFITDLRIHPDCLYVVNVGKIFRLVMSYDDVIMMSPKNENSYNLRRSLSKINNSHAIRIWTVIFKKVLMEFKNV